MLLHIQDLNVFYGAIHALRNVSLVVNAGEVVTLLGANGAGKSTTLRAIAGLMTPRAGAITFRGQDITRLPSHERTLLGVALVPEGRHVFPFLTVRENLELGGFKHRRNAIKIRTLMEQIFVMFPRLR
jgi:branched-chain amino acid transport system ATP-binding protein